MKLYSNEFLERWSAQDEVEDVFGRKVKLGGEIAFAFIDGDHSYEAALEDFKNCDRYLVQGGFILFDDSGDATNWGCARVAREASKLPDYKLISKNPNYLIQKIR